jgi:hypothetical protein
MEQSEYGGKGHTATLFHTSSWPYRSHTHLILVLCVRNSGTGQNPENIQRVKLIVEVKSPRPHAACEADGRGQTHDLIQLCENDGESQTLQRVKIMVEIKPPTLYNA